MFYNAFYNVFYNVIYKVIYKVIYNVIYNVIVIPSSTTFPYLQKRTTENTIEESRNVILTVGARLGKFIWNCFYMPVKFLCKETITAN